MTLLKIIKSKVIVFYLKIIGVNINYKAMIHNFPKLKIKGKAENIKIGKVEILEQLIYVIEKMVKLFLKMVVELNLTVGLFRLSMEYWK